MAVRIYSWRKDEDGLVHEHIQKSKSTLDESVPGRREVTHVNARGRAIDARSLTVSERRK